MNGILDVVLHIRDQIDWGMAPAPCRRNGR
jgi:hypothetical protein